VKVGEEFDRRNLVDGSILNHDEDNTLDDLLDLIDGLSVAKYLSAPTRRERERWSIRHTLQSTVAFFQSLSFHLRSFERG
jgi:hypothetical protein